MENEKWEVTVYIYIDIYTDLNDFYGAIICLSLSIAVQNYIGNT